MVAALAVAQHYRDSQITSSAPEQTVLMLYDGAIKFLQSAVEELEAGNVPKKAKLVEKAVNIIDYLQSCLDKDRGGEIAENLDKFYNYVLVELTEANLNNAASRIDAVIKLIQPIRDAWAEICSNNAKAKQMAVPSGLKTDFANTANETLPTRSIAVKI